MDKLAEIMAWKRKEIADLLRPVDEEEFVTISQKNSRQPSFANALMQSDSLGVIAEIKRRSPSSGEIAEIASAREQAERYSRAGADALSVLTDLKYFGGQLEDLQHVTHAFSASPAPLPCLRKDFMVHPYQVLEAAVAGAAAILIIVRALEDDEIRILKEAADAAGLDVLFEIHGESELERAMKAEARIVGANNRDLARFTTDLAISEELLPKVPRDVIRVSESGINTAEDAARVRAAGADAVLVGEALMKAKEPDVLLRAFKDAR